MFSTNIYLSLVLAFFVAQSLSFVVSIKPVSLPPSIVQELAPHRSPNHTFYLNTAYGLKGVASIYDDDGKAVWQVSPGVNSREILLQMAGNPNFVKTIQLPACHKNHHSTYFFNRKTQQWLVENSQQKPSDLDYVFEQKVKNRPIGMIKSKSSKYMVASLDEKDKMSAVGSRPQGNYWAVFIAGATGDELYIEDDDALTLLFFLLNEGPMCPS
ncbi:hypothetical protein CROQUDRAFT_111421 [Cronartium quercuum f. sp. fusiforme G11]|uniref:Uncharacterized protein n=1 Tax=Cronartium quercuum f. sp. fusiforme G11 TaxID=708437 RepID=A0A9P6N9K9_9BASI|nr:hypothetical protein CROQUDRAFT_111421 [Cronartium quercuum f. sp. fusiforme G11]